jgi:hypothetical protein
MVGFPERVPRSQTTAFVLLEVLERVNTLAQELGSVKTMILVDVDGEE